MIRQSPPTTIAAGQYTCGYREYPDPQHHQGLPFLAEVFAANKSVYFIAMNKGSCLKEWKGAQEFHSTDVTKHYFYCEFPDGSRVRSDPVHKKREGDTTHTNALIVIRCDIPLSLQHLVEVPSTTTNLAVNLYGTEDLEAGGAALEWNANNSYQNLPVCHGEWPAYNNTIIARNKKDYLSMATRVKLQYLRLDGDGRIPHVAVVDPALLISWIEYHRLIGIEHFYVYDSNKKAHGLLEEVLMPYIDQALVTYVHYPLSDCIASIGNNKYQLRLGQVTAMTGSLRRYAHLTKYMSHFDLDEYIILPDGYNDLKALVREQGSYDALNVKRTWLHECRHENVTAPQLPYERSLCASPDQVQAKSIMKTSRILTFFVHSPTTTMDGEIATNRTWMKRVTAAHFRSRRSHDPLNVTMRDWKDPLGSHGITVRNAVKKHFQQLPQIVAVKSDWFQSIANQ